ncbi:MAG: tetratricopeptide repeat protein [Fibrobacter sp.]|nr:tetratricopeptide repeat protein [Fibrobacter sp.]
MTLLRTKEIQAVGDDVKKEVNVQMTQQIDSLRLILDSLMESNERLQRRLIADFGMVSGRFASDMDKIDARLEEALYRLDMVVNAARTPTKRVVIDKREEMATNAPPIAEQDPNMMGQESGMGVLVPKSDEETELEKLYATARLDFQRSEYKIAFEGFKQVYEQAGQTEMGENALYWIAFCLLETKQEDKGIQVLERILKQFPQGNKVCLSLFKLAQISETKTETQNQVQYLQRLTAQPQCRETNEAYRAIELLNELVGSDGKIRTQKVPPPPAAPPIH